MNNIQKLIFSSLIFLPALFLANVANVFAVPPNYILEWEDQFDGNQFGENWGYYHLGPRRDAINVEDAVSIADGFLTIKSYTKDGKHYTSMVSTIGKFERTYGYWEARIDFDDSPAEWSAFWLMSLGMKEPYFKRTDLPGTNPNVGHPDTLGMEIDIIEHRAVGSGGNDISNNGLHTIHWDGYFADHKSKSFAAKEMNLANGFHTYGLEWTETEYNFYIDGIKTWIATPISKHPEYIILSSEVEGGGWAGDIPLGGYGDKSSSSTKMTVDYVRYYANRSEIIPPAAPQDVLIK